MNTAKIAPSDPEMNIKRHMHSNERGLGWIVTALFVVGDLAGGGIVVLPTAIVQSDYWFGTALFVVIGLIMCYTSSLLGVSWTILQRRWPEYRVHCRKPYPEMGARAMGRTVKLIVSICIDLTQFGIAVVYLLLSAKNIRDFLDAFFEVKISFCMVILVLGACLLPLTFLKSPQDFWWAVVLAMITTLCAVILMLIGAAMDYSTCAPERGFNEKVVISNYLLALGTFLFSYGGHAAFPTILHDMQRPYQFTSSSILAFIIVTFLYAPLSILGYYTYGNSLKDSIINSVQSTAIQQGANILITLHCILTLTIVFNPLNQEAEEIFNVPHHFCWQRVMVRTGMMCLIVFIAETLPTFGPLLDLVGGSTLTFTSLVFPCLFYLYLNTGDQMAHDENEKHRMDDDIRPTFSDVLMRSPKWELFLCFAIMVFGVIGGSAATYGAVRELTSTHFVAPCYVQPFLNGAKQSVEAKHLNCCGAGQNVTVNLPISMCNSYHDFYSQYSE